jgi:hypothetical protein
MLAPSTPSTSATSSGTSASATLEPSTAAMLALRPWPGWVLMMVLRPDLPTWSVTTMRVLLHMMA